MIDVVPVAAIFGMIFYLIAGVLVVRKKRKYMYIPALGIIACYVIMFLYGIASVFMKG